MRLRHTEPRDAPALAAISAAGFESYASFAPGWAPPDDALANFERDLTAAIARPDTWGMLAEVDGEIAGHAAFLPASASRFPTDDPRLAHLWQLFVAPTYWGSGVATRLLAAAVEAAALRDFTEMRLFTPAAHGRARRFYEREGWSPAGPAAPSPLGLEVIEYRRPLAYVPPVVAAVFGDADPEAAVAALCAERLGTPVAAFEFQAGGVGRVFGVRLADGRRVVVKAHRADAGADRLAAVQAVQAALAGDGFPAPRPLLPPTPLAHGIAVAEELLDRGETVPADVPGQRARMAADLHRLVGLATPHRAQLGDHTGFLTGEGDDVFPVPHDHRFDLARPGGEWIDALAAEARAALRGWDGPRVVGHADWRVEHLRYADGELCAVHDWDSLVVRPEAALVGALAGAFSVDWTQIERCGVPTPDDAAGFVADYEAARGRPFGAAERELARAALVFQLAYNARCEWSDWGAIRPDSQCARLAAFMGA